jgi:Flp pilus assembly protein TadD
VAGWLGVLLILVATCAAYSLALGIVPAGHARAGWIWDDDVHVTQNLAITRGTGHDLADIWTWPWQRLLNAPTRAPVATPQYYPLVFSTFWLEWKFWGGGSSDGAALGFHVLNVLLHAANALLVWRILRRLAVPGALLAALLFATHPLMVETVAWITERKNLLSAFFYLLAVLAYLKFARIGGAAGRTPTDDVNPQARPSSRRWGFYALVFLCFVLAMLSKTVACSLPVTIGLLLWWKRRLSWADIVALLLPVTIGLLRWWKRQLSWADIVALLLMVPIGIGGGLLTRWIERQFIGAAGPEWDLSALQRFLIAAHALCHYTWSLLVPSDLVFIYPRWDIDPAQAVQWIYPLGILAVVGGLVWLALRGRRAGVVAAGFAFVTIFPALGFFNVYPMRYSFVADHFAYLASLGLLVPLAAALAWLASRLDTRDRWLAWLAAVVLVSGLVLLTRQQTRPYRDEEALWRFTIDRNPACWMAAENLADLLQRRAAAAAPDDPTRALSIAQADTYYQVTLRLRPDYAKPYNAWGHLALLQGRANLAAQRLATGAALDPHDPRLLATYGTALCADHDFAKAAGVLEEACRLEVAAELPSVPTRNDLAGAYLALGRQEDAERVLRGILAEDPDNAAALNNLGRLRHAVGELAEAESLLRRAIAADPQLAGAHFNLGAVLAAQKFDPPAVIEFRKALALDPKMADAHGALAELFSRPGSPLRDAAAALREAREAGRLSAYHDETLLTLWENIAASVGDYATAREVAGYARKLAEAAGPVGAEKCAAIDARLAEYRRAQEK